jgi:hypothetical protein
MLSTSCVASFSVNNCFCMHVGVGSPSHLHIGNKIFEVLYIICDLFWFCTLYVTCFGFVHYMCLVLVLYIICVDINPSDRTVALGSTQRLT